MPITKTTATKLELEYIDGRNWMLTQDFSVTSVTLNRAFTIPAGFVTDFNSIPQPLWNILLPTDFGEAAVVHDYLYRYNSVTRSQADQTHREFVKYRNAPAWKVIAIYAGLRVGGWVPWNRYREAEKNNAAVR